MGEAWLTVDSPVGRLVLRRRGGMLTALEWSDRPLPACGDDPLLQEAAAQLAGYFAGRLHCFNLPLAPDGTAFRQRVWAAMQAIPYGRTRTYGELAQDLGSAARAVGGACGANPLPIIIPCHRVLAATGAGGYSGRGGLETKSFLLGLEAGRQPRSKKTDNDDDPCNPH